MFDSNDQDSVLSYDDLVEKYSLGYERNGDLSINFDVLYFDVNGVFLNDKEKELKLDEFIRDMQECCADICLTMDSGVERENLSNEKTLIEGLLERIGFLRDAVIEMGKEKVVAKSEILNKTPNNSPIPKVKEVMVSSESSLNK